MSNLVSCVTERDDSSIVPLVKGMFMKRSHAERGVIIEYITESAALDDHVVAVLVDKSFRVLVGVPGRFAGKDLLGKLLHQKEICLSGRAAEDQVGEALVDHLGAGAGRQVLVGLAYPEDALVLDRDTWGEG